MKTYDVVVVGSGSGEIIVEEALAHGLKVALIDRGPLGGTCLNVGCIPSKMLIVPADRIVDIWDSRKLGVRAEIERVDFKSIMERTRRSVQTSEQQIRQRIRKIKDLEFYGQRARFVNKSTLRVGGQVISGGKIFLASGARPYLPPVKGLRKIRYLTNETVFALNRKPRSLIIIGGGYIAAEFAHFFAAVGTTVTVLQRDHRLVKEEEPEISALLKKKLGERMKIRAGMEAVEAVRRGKLIVITARDKESGQKQEFAAEEVLVAAGRKSNADLLDVEKAGIETDEKNYIRVNEYLETSQKNIWAYGDAIGQKMYRHAANHEAELVFHNAVHGREKKMDFLAVPHAVFTSPQIASVGMTEAEARTSHKILVGTALYSTIAMGESLMDTESFAKAIVEKETLKILGFHLIGPQASLLIQEVVDAMSTDGTILPILRGIHIHPALSEIVVRAFVNLKEKN
jgi:mycothione reductase